MDMKSIIQKSTKLAFALAGGLGLALTSSGGALADGPFGVLGLYNVENPEVVRFDDENVASLGCELRREGMIAGAQGGIGIDQPNRFVLLTCDSSILSDTGRRAKFNTLAENTIADVVLEGPIADMPGASGGGEITDRQYILKISYYNNRDIDGRARALADIDVFTSALPDRYIVESFIGVNHASGMATPDEIVVIYYDSPEQGERFRQNNDEVLDMVGEFNGDHLDEFVYFVGKANR